MKKLLSILVILGGIFSYSSHLDLLNLTIGTISVLFLIFFYVFVLRKNAEKVIILLPFGAGLIIFIARLFYWDEFDFSQRLNNLLLISLFFSLLLWIIKSNIIKKSSNFFNKLSLKKRLLLIFIFVELCCFLAAIIITHRHIKLGGDEPHYLLISQSVIKDFDLNVANQYKEKQYQEFMAVESLGIHGYSGKKGGNYIYSMHLPGVSVTLAPLLIFKMKGKLFFIVVRTYLGLFAAGLAIFVYLIALRLWKNAKLALFIVSVFSLSAPIFFHSFHVYPEIQVMLFVLAAIYLLIFYEKKNNFSVLLAGFLLSLLLFWGVKYAIFMYLLILGFFIYFIKIKLIKKAFLLLVFPFISQIIFWLYLFQAYGNISPMSIYMNEGQKNNFFRVFTEIITIKMRAETLLNYFFDQRDGLLCYSPFYFFAFPGFLLALKKTRKYFYHLLISVPAILFILSYAVLTHRGGYAPQARTLTPVIWIFMMFGVIYFRETNNEFFKKVFRYIPIYSFFIVFYQLFHPFTLYQETTHGNYSRAGLIFQQWSNINLYIPKFLPSYIKVKNNHEYLPNIIFLLLFILLVIFSLKKIRDFKLVNFIPLFFIGSLFIFVIFPRFPVHNPTYVENGDGSFYKIYGVSKYPKKVSERKFKFLQPGTYNYTVSTFKKINYLIMEIENLQRSQADVFIYNFDKLIKVEKLHLLGRNTFYFKDLDFKILRNNYFYRLNVVIKASDADKILFNLKFQPARRL